MSSPEITVKIKGDTSNYMAAINSVNTATVNAGNVTNTTFGRGISNARVLRASFGDVGSTMISTSRQVISGIGGMVSSLNGVYDAQQRVNVAQISYTLAVREYGAGSLQAAKSLDQLKVAQNGVGIAQLGLNLQYLQFALSVGPQLYATVSKLIAASMGMTIQNFVETASWYAKAAAIGVTAVALGAATFGISLLAAGAMTNNTISQQNTFNNVSQGNPQNLVDYTSNALASNVKSVTRP